MEPPTAIRAFESYAHEDAANATKLHHAIETQFKSDTLFSLSIWTDHAILVGEDWDPTIKKALDESQAGLLFVSRAFLASKYVTGTELPKLLKTPGKIVLPVMLEQVDFGRTNLRGLEQKQIFTLDGKAYGACSPGLRRKFEFELYKALHDRLKKEFGDGH
jgi:hypothetical protein